MIQIKYPRIILVSPYSNNITIIYFLIQHTLKEEVTPQKKILSIIMCKHSSRVTDCQSTKSWRLGQKSNLKYKKRTKQVI